MWGVGGWEGLCDGEGDAFFSREDIVNIIIIIIIIITIYLRS